MLPIVPDAKRSVSATASSSPDAGAPASARSPEADDACTERTGPGDRALQVDVVARELEEDAAAASRVDEPRARRAGARHGAIVAPELGRAEAAAHEHPGRVPREGGSQRRQEIEAAPLVAHGADGAAPPPRVDDPPAVVERARERLLEVDGEAALEARDGRVGVQRRWGADERRVELARCEHRLPVRRALGADLLRKVRGTRAVDVADDRDLDPRPAAQRLDVTPRDRAGADEADPHATPSCGRRTKNWYWTPPLVEAVVQIIGPLADA